MNADLSMVQSEAISTAPPLLNPVPKWAGWRRAAQRYVLQWVAVLVLSAVVCVLINRFIVEPVEVKGQSMYPTLHNADRYFLNRWVYRFHSPQAGDLVVFKDPTDGKYDVKRVIATPGESVLLKGGHVFVDGRQLREPYLAPGTVTTTLSSARQEFVLCGQNQFFMLGDNRGVSFDSRLYGPVPARNIVGELIR